MATTDVSPTPRPRHSAAPDEETPVEAGAASPADPTSTAGRTGPWWLDARLVAVLTWVLGVGVAFLIVRVGRADPVSVRGAVMPVGIGAFVFAVLLVAAWRVWRRFADLALGVLVGAYAAWVALVTKAALYGTVMPYGGMVGDARRIAAQAVKYTGSWGSTDLFLPNLPSDYPPLYTWLTGRWSQLSGTPAWALLQNTQVLWLSGTVVVVFLLWRKLVPAPVAAVIAMLPFVNNSNAVKPYEVIALAVMVPWIVATFGTPPRGRLHWLPAGIVGGLIFLTYQGYLVFMVFGVLAIAWWAWRGADNRLAYLRHLGLVALTAFVVASWYAVPYIWASLTSSGSFSSDTFQSGALANDPLPLHFLEANPTGVLQLIGVVGLIAAFKRSWWARPLAALLLGTFAFFILAALRFVLTGHTMFYQYAVAPIVAVCVAAGVLTVADLLAHVADHPNAATLRRVVVVLTVSTVAWSSLGLWRAWMPTTVTGTAYPRISATAGRAADLAHQESLPDLSRSQFAPPDPDPGAVPVSAIRAELAKRRGAGFTPMVLSADERLFSFVPWYEYVAFSPTASPALARWSERNAQIVRLRATQDPNQFAALAADTAFGPIDVFLLRHQSEAEAVDTDGLVWRPDTVFTPAQFSPAAFDRVDLPNNFVMFVRKA